MVNLFLQTPQNISPAVRRGMLPKNRKQNSLSTTSGTSPVIVRKGTSSSQDGKGKNRNMERHKGFGVGGIQWYPNELWQMGSMAIE